MSQRERCGPRSVLRVARKLGLGRLALYTWHRPIGLLHQSVAEGGPIQQRRTAAGQREMRAAAERLPPLAVADTKMGLGVNFLSGTKYWDQTVFCFASLQANCERKIEVTIFDDGTLSEVATHVLRVIPWARLVMRDEIDERLDAHLPTSRFPTLRAHRLGYKHLRKLTDLHAGAAGWTVTLDSDMLFFRRPDALLEWCEAPRHAIYIEDVKRCYGYSEELLEELSPPLGLPARANVGLYALDGKTIDWARAEFLCKTLLEREGPHYVHEQVLTAFLLADQNARPLPAEDYVVQPDLDEGRNPKAALHHYVAHSKRSYFQFGWREILKKLDIAACNQLQASATCVSLS